MVGRIQDFPMFRELEAELVHCRRIIESVDCFYQLEKAAMRRSDWLDIADEYHEAKHKGE